MPNLPPLNLANFKLPASGGATSVAPTSPAQSALPPLDLSKFKLGYSMQEQTPDNLPTTADQINSEFQSGQISAPSTVIQDVGEAAQETANTPLFKWSPLGWASDLIGAGTNALASNLKAGVDPVAKAIGTGLRNLVGGQTADKVGQAVAGNPVVKAFQSEATNPDVAGDINAVNQVAGLAGAVALDSPEAAEGAMEAKDTVTQPGKPLGDLISSVQDKMTQKAAASEQTEWERPSTNPKAMYSKAGAIIENAKAMGNDIPETLVKNGTHVTDNIDGKVYNTGSTADAYRTDAGKASNELLRPSLKIADYSTPRTPVNDVIDTTVKQIENSNEAPDVIEERVAKAQAKGEALQRRYPDGMKLTDMHDEKINYSKGAKYSPVNDTTVNNNAEVNRAFGRTLASTVEAKAPEGVPVKEFNAELQKQYQAADYLDALDGKTVPKSTLSKLVNYGAKVAGAAIGQSLGGGILVDVGGYQIGGMVESMLENMPNPIKGHFLNMMEMTNPDAFDAMSKYMSSEQMDALQRRALPEPSYIPVGAYKGAESGVDPASSREFAQQQNDLIEQNTKDVAASKAQKEQESYQAEQEKEQQATKELATRKQNEVTRTKLIDQTNRFKSYDTYKKYVENNPSLLKKMQLLGDSPKEIWEFGKGKTKAA